MVVYPRWRGELIYSKPSECIPGGLSPLARGTRDRRCYAELLKRFIPAGAGNSSPAPAPIKSASVYPRWRGELTPRKRYPHPIAGLSPLARGTPRVL